MPKLLTTNYPLPNHKGFTLIRTCFASRFKKLYRSFAEPCQGFTLVELMVVVTIIAILTGIGLYFFAGAQQKTRDAKRKEDLNSIAHALEIYYQRNKEYPASDWIFSKDPGNWLDSKLDSTYIDKVPVDPINQNNCANSYLYCYVYGYRSVGPDCQLSTTNPQHYILFAYLEADSSLDHAQAKLNSGCQWPGAGVDLPSLYTISSDK